MELSNIDWDAIASQLPHQKDTRLISSPMSQIDYFQEKAWAAAANRSLAADTQSLLSAQIRCHREARMEAIAFLATQNGMSFEDCFVALVKGEFKPAEPLQDPEK